MRGGGICAYENVTPVLKGFFHSFLRSAIVSFFLNVRNDDVKKWLHVLCQSHC